MVLAITGTDRSVISYKYKLFGTSRGHELALITVGPPARPRRSDVAAGLIANDSGELSEDDGTA